MSSYKPLVPCGTHFFDFQEHCIYTDLLLLTVFVSLYTISFSQGFLVDCSTFALRNELEEWLFVKCFECLKRLFVLIVAVFLVPTRMLYHPTFDHSLFVPHPQYRKLNCLWLLSIFTCYIFHLPGWLHSQVGIPFKLL